MDVTIAQRAQGFLRNIPDERTPPATPQLAPVMDKYSGLRLDPNSFSKPHQRIAATKRNTPHTDRLNTNNSSKVTLKGRLRGMDQFQ